MEIVFNTMPKSVWLCYERTLLSMLGIHCFQARIVGSKRVSVPVKYLNLITSTRKVSAYKIKVQMPGCVQASYMKKPYVSISESLSLSKEAYDRIDDYPSLRDLEDDLLQKAMVNSEKEQEWLWNQPFDLPLIEKFQGKMDAIVQQHGSLISWYLFFKEVEGFDGLFEKIISNFHVDSFNTDAKASLGFLFELECAYFIETIESDQVIEFDQKHRSDKSCREFDLLTASGRMIECKYTEKAVNEDKDRIVDQAQIALSLNKQFALYVREKISDDTKTWLFNHGIICKDNIGFFAHL